MVINPDDHKVVLLYDIKLRQPFGKRDTVHFYMAGANSENHTTLPLVLVIFLFPELDVDNEKADEIGKDPVMESFPKRVKCNITSGEVTWRQCLP